MIRLWTARFLAWLSGAASRWSEAAYRSHYRSENRRAYRESLQREREKLRRDAIAVNDLIASTRPNRVGSPLHRDR